MKLYYLKDIAGILQRILIQFEEYLELPLMFISLLIRLTNIDSQLVMIVNKLFYCVTIIKFEFMEMCTWKSLDYLDHQRNMVKI